MLETDLAWVAGLIDGEGCLFINRRGPSKHTRQKNFSYTPTISIELTHFPTLFKVKDILQAGRLTYRPKRAINHRNQIQWQLCGVKNNKPILERIIPYLFLKKPDAQILYELCLLPISIGARSQPQEILDKKEELYQKLFQIKKYSFELPEEELKKHKVPTNYKESWAKDLRSTEKKLCLYCKIEMPKYHLGGNTERTYCSNRCRYDALKTTNSYTQKYIQKLVENEEIIRNKNPLSLL